MVINEELLAARKKVAQTRPRFIRPALVKVGYRSPKASRGLHPSGYRDNLIHNVTELAKLDPKGDAARIAHTVGKKKRIEIINKALQLGIKVLNPGNLMSKIQKEKEKTGE
jgi:ribosomal protein L32E